MLKDKDFLRQSLLSTSARTVLRLEMKALAFPDLRPKSSVQSRGEAAKTARVYIDQLYL